MSRSPSVLLVLAGAVAALLLATPARAEDIRVAVERTVARSESLEVLLRTTSAEAVDVRAWRIAHPEALLDAGVALDRGERLAWLHPDARLEDERQVALRTAAGLEAMLVARGRPVRPGQREAMALRLGAPGLYLVAVEAGESRALVCGLVSDLGLVTKRWPGGLLAWAVDRTSGEPQAEVEVTLHAGARELARGLTDEDGLVRFEAALPARVAVRAHHEGHDAFSAVDEAGAGAHAAPRRLYMHTHQPAYRPGERVEIRGILRVEEDDAWRLDADTSSLALALHAPDGGVHDLASPALSATMGTFAVGYDLPEDAPTGRWQIVATGEDDAWAAPLVVDAYRRPPFEVLVAGDAARVLAGEEIAWTVRGRFYDGGVVAGATVRWRLLHQPMDTSLFAEDALVRLFFGTERAAYRPETIAQGEGRLDAEGRLRVQSRAPADRPDGVLVLEATVLGPDRLAVAGTGRVGVTVAPVLVDLETDRHLYGPEDVARATVRIETADGRPAAGRRAVVTLALAPEAADGALPEERWLQRLELVTQQDGTAQAELPLAGPGRYVVRAAVPRTDEEPAGGPAHAHLHLWAAGEATTPGHGRGLRLVADRDHYAAGDEARLLALPPGGPRPVLATLEGDGLLEARVLRPEDGSLTWRVALEARHERGVFATVVSVDHGLVSVASHTLRMPPRSKLLDVDVRPDAPEVEPGATAGVTIGIRDADGAPVAGAETSLAVVDASLLALHPDPTAPIEAFFHPPRRNGVATARRMDFTSAGSVVPSPEQLAALRRLREERAGAPLVGRPVPDAAPAASESAGFDGTPPPATAPAPAARAQPGALHDEGGEADLDAEAPAEEVLEALDDVRGGAGGVRKEEGGAPEPIRVREDLRAAVHWSAALRTDAQGLVRVEDLTYGDSLTRWRLRALAVDATTRVGTGEATVRTRRDVSVRATLPRFLLEGDRVVAPVLLRNLTDAAVDATWHLLFGEDAERHEGALRLEPGATHVVERAFEPRRPREVLVEAGVRSPAGGDALRQTLRVAPRGIETVRGISLRSEDGAGHVAPLEVPAGALPGSLRLTASIEPAYAHVMLAALPYLEGYPHGCTEQTMSRFVPLLAAQEALLALGSDGVLGRDVPAAIEAGLARLAVLQHADGGFGWWERDATDAGMTALVLGGMLRVTGSEETAARAQALARPAAARLAAILAADHRLEPATEAAALRALAQARRAGLVAAPEAGEDALALLLADRVRRVDETPPIGLALLLEAALALDDASATAALRTALEAAAVPTEDGLAWGTSRAQAETEGPTTWREDPIEATATAVRALLAAGSAPADLAPAVRWLVDHRVGGDRWRSTRDTAAAVATLAAWTKTVGDLGAGRGVRLTLDGTVVWEGTVEAADLEGGRLTVPIEAPAIQPGAVLHLGLESEGGTATAGVALRAFETGPAVAATQHGFEVVRRFHLLELREGDDGVVVVRTPLTETVPSGALVEVEIEVRTGVPREYVMITSPHPAGFEPHVETGLDVPGRRPAAEGRIDRRDEATFFFLGRVPAGESFVVRHTLRATHVGTFTALPAQAELMYFPTVRGTSDGEVWQVTASGEAGREEDR